ncbi:hypothetical protein DOTSEDRAFT_32123 [Dothistroma septosporum NZE10]|uniref:Uncharacterized protein n=1 Tax=Dothistroma septosporum (strain NZE10 / CBS 128990) TaxID=675120 RepID=N1PW56_DOTSN|nr:hypothetical protein DOTSEDRAFT_32123 [Dothistroma septosporum NZE10]
MWLTSVARINHDTPSTNRLSSLPAELLKQIFRLLLEPESMIEIRDDVISSVWDYRLRKDVDIESEIDCHFVGRKMETPALLRTCRHFHSDCTQTLLRTDSFLLPSSYVHQILSLVRESFTVITPSGAATLKDLTIELEDTLRDAFGLGHSLSDIEPVFDIERACAGNDFTPFLGIGRSVFLELHCDSGERERVLRDLSMASDPQKEQNDPLLCIHKSLDENVADAMSAFEAWKDVLDKGNIYKDTAEWFRWYNEGMRKRRHVEKGRIPKQTWQTRACHNV